MSGVAVTLHLWGACWAAAMGRACWQGGGAIALAWALCRLLPRLPGRYQCWLWRLAYLKLLVAFVWTAPLELPLLTAPAANPVPTAGMTHLRAKTPAWSAYSITLDASADAGPTKPLDALSLIHI